MKMNKNIKKGIQMTENKFIPLLKAKDDELMEVKEDLGVMTSKAKIYKQTATEALANNEELIEMTNSLLGTNERLINQNKEQSDRLQQREVTINTLLTENKELTTENKDLGIEIETLNKELNEVNNELLDKHCEIEELNDNIDLLQIELEEANDRVDDIHDDIMKIMDEFAPQFKSNDIELKELNNEFDRLTIEETEQKEALEYFNRPIPKAIQADEGEVEAIKSRILIGLAKFGTQLKETTQKKQEVTNKIGKTEENRSEIQNQMDEKILEAVHNHPSFQFTRNVYRELDW